MKRAESVAFHRGVAVMGYGRFTRSFLLLGGLAIVASAGPASAGARSEAQTLNRILREVG